MEEFEAILPDDYEATPAPEVEAEQEVEATPDVEDTKPTEEPAETVETPKLKVKYNHEEKEISLEEAATLAQKGLNYEKAIERAQQEAAQQARDATYASLGLEWNGIPITTEAEYKQAEMERDLVNKYRDRDMPDEVVQELVEGRRFREKYSAKEAEEGQYKELFKAYPDLDVKVVNPETWQKAGFTADGFNPTGTSLKQAYVEQELQDIRSQNQELLSQLKVVKQNQENLKKAPVGSVTAHGSTEVAAEDDFLRGFNSI